MKTVKTGRELELENVNEPEYVDRRHKQAIIEPIQRDHYRLRREVVFGETRTREKERGGNKHKIRFVGDDPVNEKKNF